MLEAEAPYCVWKLVQVWIAWRGWEKGYKWKRNPARCEFVGELWLPYCPSRDEEEGSANQNNYLMNIPESKRGQCRCGWWLPSLAMFDGDTIVRPLI